MKFVLMALTVTSLIASAQKPVYKFGDVTIDELKMNVYGKDSSATAIILFDKGDVYLSEDLRVEYKRHIRIKFFSKESIETWATKTIYLTHNEDGISKLKAVTYNLENGIIEATEMPDDAVFKTRIDRYTDQLRFTLPKVKEGSIIEYRYNLTTNASLLPSWQFQSSIPTVVSDFQVSIPRNFTFRQDIQGQLRITDHTSKHDGAEERWVMNDVPAFKEEPFMSNPDDYISRISFYLSELFIPGRPIVKFNRSWWPILKNLNSEPDFGMQISGSGFLKKIVSEVADGKITEDEKIRAIVTYVKNSITWNGVIDKIPDHSFRKALEEKKGSSSEINLLIVSMLLKANVNAFPVLISTRDHGKIRSTYLFSEFNDVICLVKSGDKNILIDGTDKHLNILALPSRCLNGNGLVVSKEDVEWIPIRSIRTRTAISTEYEISEDGEIKGTLTISRDGLDASQMRKDYYEKGTDKYWKEAFAEKTWEVSKSSFENIDNANSSTKESYYFSGTGYLQIADSLIYFNPFLIDKTDENKFKSDERKYAIDFVNTFDKVYMAKIHLPKNYRVETMPKSKVVVMPDNSGKFSYNINSTENAISLTTQFIINKSKFSVVDYPLLKELYNLIVSIEEEQIVLKRK